MEVKPTITDSGFQSISGINDIYKKAKLNGKVILKVDMLNLLTDYFTDHTIANFKLLLMALIMETISDEDKVVDILKKLYCADTTFKQYVAEIFHFQKEELYNDCFYNLILKGIQKKVRSSITIFLQGLAQTRYRFLFESDLSVYFAIDDIDKAIHILKGYEVEVISRAKVWNHKVEYFLRQQ